MIALYVHKRLKSLLLVSIMLALVLAGRPALATQESALKRIGVVSMAGDTLFERRLGVVAFGNKWEETEISALGLDDAFEARIEEFLAGIGTYEVVPITTDRAPLIATYNKGTIVNNWRYLRFKKTAPIFAEIAAANDLDYVLVLGADAFDVVEGVMRIEGVGIYTSKRLGGASAVYHLIGQLALIDGATGKPVEKEYLRIGSRWTEGFGAFPVIAAPADLVGKAFADYSEEERAMLVAKLIEVGDRAFPRTISKVLSLPDPPDAPTPDAGAEAAPAPEIERE